MTTDAGPKLRTDLAIAAEDGPSSDRKRSRRRRPSEVGSRSVRLREERLG